MVRREDALNPAGKLGLQAAELELLINRLYRGVTGLNITVHTKFHISKVQ